MPYPWLSIWNLHNPLLTTLQVLLSLRTPCLFHSHGWHRYHNYHNHHYYAINNHHSNTTCHWSKSSARQPDMYEVAIPLPNYQVPPQHPNVRSNPTLQQRQQLESPKAAEAFFSFDFPLLSFLKWLLCRFEAPHVAHSTGVNRHQARWRGILCSQEFWQASED